MKRYCMLFVVCLFLSLLTSQIKAGEKSIPAELSSSAEKPLVVGALYPFLTRGPFLYARASDLEQDVLLKAGGLVINEKELTEEINKSDEQMRPQLKKNAFFVLEQITTFRLFLAEAKEYAGKNGTDISGKDENALIQDYLQTLVKTAKVGELEITEFYNDKKETLGGASLAQIRPQIEKFLHQQKQQKIIDEYVQNLGKKKRIEVSVSWLKVQAALAQDNPVDNARTSGRPSLVDFGSTGCVPCEMLAPILEKLKEKYKDKVNVVVVNVVQEPMLASRYGIQVIPVQIFFDKTGKEVFRHTGFFPQEQIEAKLLEMGVK